MAGNTLHVSRHAVQVKGGWWEVGRQGLLPRKHLCVCRSEHGICMEFHAPEPRHGWTSHEMLFVFAVLGSVPILHVCSPSPSVVYQRGDQQVLESGL